MSIGSAWTPTKAYERLGTRVSKLALETIYDEWGQPRLRAPGLSVAIEELTLRNVALLEALEGAELLFGSVDQLRRELRAYQTYVRANQSSLTTLSESRNENDERCDELLVVLMICIADEYLSEALVELAGAEGRDPNGDAAPRRALASVDDSAHARWNDCLTRKGVGLHSDHSIDTMHLARALRQLLVHNDGIVTRDFIATYPEFPAVVETRFHLPHDFALDVVYSVGSLINAVDHYFGHTIARVGRTGYLLRDP